MADIVTMPKLGFDMAEGTLVRWVVAEGEQVSKGSVLAEIETDKATVEVESTYSGVVARHLVEEGSVVPISTPIAVIGEEGEQIDFNQLLGDAAPGEKEGAEGPGQAVAPSAETGLRPEAEVEDQEALPRGSATEEARAEPTPAKAGAGMGGDSGGPGQAEAPTAETGLRPEAEVEDQEALPRASATEEARAEAPPAEKAPEDEGLPDGVRASPLARRMAEERGVDLRKINGSGPQGRIVKSDVEAFVQKPPVSAAAPTQAAPAPAAPPAPEKKPAAPPLVFTQLGPPPPDERIPLNRLRAAIGRRMTEAKQQVPHFYVTHEYDMAPVMALRKEINAMLGESERLSVNDFIVKAVALALRQYPNLNTVFDKDAVVRKGQVNIGVAVAVEGGLLTVVCHDTDRKPLRQISTEVRTMAGRAREGKVRPDDIEGSTFSVSNLGMFDVEDFLAIINPPEAAILAVGAAREVPVVKDGEIKPGMRMKATISVDHRVSDGAEAAQFLQALAAYIEQPMRLLI